jgi:hypothetical protein
MRYIICDIDGVVAHRPVRDSAGRVHPDTSHDYKLVGIEYLDKPMFIMLKAMSLYPLIFLTGRHDTSYVRDATQSWLSANGLGYYFRLIMKNPELGPPSTDAAYKLSCINSLTDLYGSAPMLVIEDNKSICEYLMSNGVDNVFNYRASEAYSGPDWVW